MPQGVTIDFNANLAKFENSLNKATRDMNKFADKAKKSGGILKQAFSVGLGVGLERSIRNIGAAIKESIDAGDRVQKVSKQLGATTEALSELKYAADLSGVAFEQVFAGMRNLQKNAADATDGLASQSRAFEKLGLDAKAFSALAPAKQLEAFADALLKIENQSEKTQIRVALMGRAGAQMAALMEKGGAGIREMRKEAHELGLTLSQVEADKLAEMNDELARFNARSTALSQRIAVDLFPLLIKLQEGFSGAASAVKSLFSEFKNAVNLNEISDAQRDVWQLQDALKEANKQLEQTRKFSESNQDQFGPTVEHWNTQVQKLSVELAFAEAKLDRLTGKGDLFDGFKPPGIPEIPDVAEKLTPSKTSQKEFEQFVKEFNKLRDTLDPVTAKTRDYEQAVSLLNRAWSEGIISGERLDELMLVLATDTDAVTEAQERLNEQRAQAVGLIKELDTGSYYRDKILEVQELAATFPELADSLAEVELEMQSKWDEMRDQGKETAATIDDAWKDLGFTFSSAFEEAILSGNKLSDVLKGLAKDILQIATRKLVTEPLGNFLSGAFSSFSFKAQGGPVFAGSPYIVGEQGPELFVPSTSGNIVTNQDLTKNRGPHQRTITVNMHLHGVTDAGSFSRNQDQIMGRMQFDLSRANRNL